MTAIRSILAATDFSPGANAAVGRAVQLAEAHGASLRMLYAFDAGVWQRLEAGFDAAGPKLEPGTDARIRERLIDAAQSLATQTGLEVGAEFAIGTAHDAIAAGVNSIDASLLVIGARALPSIVGLGSVAAKALRAPACPVLIVRCGQCQPYRQVLTALDIADGGADPAALAVAAFPAARHVLLHAVDPALHRALGLGGMAREQAHAWLDSIHAHADRELRALARSLGGQAVHPITTEIVDDAPARAILAFAASMPADCVVVGHHGQSAPAQAFLGSMAQHVIHHTMLDVLVVP
ncbi:MAG: universal stress protein [Burkholderiaceae bacterium]